MVNGQYVPHSLPIASIHHSPLIIHQKKPPVVTSGSVGVDFKV